MRFFNIFKKQVSPSDSSSGGSRSPVSGDGDANFTFRAFRSRQRGVDKIIRVCGAHKQDEIQKIKELQQQQLQDSDTPDTSFEEEELRRPSPNMDIFFKDPRRGRPSTDHRDSARKSDASSEASPSSSSPWCRSALSTTSPGTPQQFSPRASPRRDIGAPQQFSPRASPRRDTGPPQQFSPRASPRRDTGPPQQFSPRASPRRDTGAPQQFSPRASPRRDTGHPLPALPVPPSSSPLSKRRGLVAPQPLPLLPRSTVQNNDWSPSPCSSPLGRSPHRQCQSPRYSPRSCPRWEKLAEIGRGSFATVYQGLSNDNGRMFAVKVIHDSSSTSDTQQELAVLTKLSKLDHPNIVRYYGSGIDENAQLCIFMELMTNSLKAVLNKLGKGMEESTIRTYTRQILNGLVYLHENNTIHRDIKCANILVNPDGQVKLADFGVAKQTSEASSFKGTLAYMAPEMMSPCCKTVRRSYGTAVDIWSLGCTVLEMADGKGPWSELPGFGFYFKLSKGQLPPIPDHLSPVAKDFIRACLRYNPEERPTASQLLQHPFIADSTTPRSSPRPSAAGTPSVGSAQHFFHVEGLRRNGNLNLVSREEHVAALLNRTRTEPQQLIYRPYEGAQVFQGVIL